MFPKLAPGARLGPYELVAPLGAGGMGEVWRARDPRLGREVAIKRILAGEGDPARRRRFEHEARAVARLQHPNLLVVFDVGEADGAPYLVTELLEGATLRARIADGPPPTEVALGWAREIARGLRAAHRSGVVHRDLKPENVLITTEGGVKLLDFGLARLIEPDPTAPAGEERTWTQLTAPGTVVGTVGYLAPEQVRGRPADARADQFAFGVVLYELLAGRRPFAGGSALQDLSALLTEAAPPLPARVPPEVARIVTRCLEKEPERRFASTDDLVAALEATARPAGTPTGARSVAVLPFRELAARSAEGGELGLGIADAIVTELAAARSLVVRPTAAIVRYVEGEVEPERAGRELGVDAVVDGRFQRAGDRLRVTVQLIEIDGGRPLWADKIDSSLSDPFRMQDEISRRVAAALAAELEAPVRRPVRPAADAYELYLRGRAHLARESLADARRAVELLEGAVRADARFALGWAALADAYLMLALEFEPGADHHERAEAACTRALELDADLPEGRYLRGRMAWSERGGWDHARCLAECAVAVAGRPGLHEAWHRLGTVLAHVSLLDAAPLCFARAHEINPHDLSSYEIWGFSRLLRFELEPALAMSDEVWREAPSAWAAYQRGLCRLHLGREGDAEEAVASGLRRFPGSPLVESLAALLAALRGDAGEARRRIASVHENRLAINHYHHAQYELARTLAHLGELGPGFAELEAAAVTGFPCLDFFRRDPLLAPLRSGPQWTSFEARLEREQAGFRRLWSSLAVRV